MTIWAWLRGQSEREAAEEKLAAELERARARYLPGMDRPDYALMGRRGLAWLAHDATTVRQWRGRAQGGL